MEHIVVTGDSGEPNVERIVVPNDYGESNVENIVVPNDSGKPNVEQIVVKALLGRQCGKYSSTMGGGAGDPRTPIIYGARPFSCAAGLVRGLVRGCN